MDFIKDAGAGEKDTAKAMPEVLELLTEALAGNFSRQEEALALTNALSKDHDGSILDNLPDFIDNFQDGPGDGILRHLYSRVSHQCEGGLSRQGQQVKAGIQAEN